MTSRVAATEIVGLRNSELSRRIERGVERLRSIDVVPRSYIPPYNGIDSTALDVLSRHFDVVFGGPESVRWLGCLPGPCRLRNAWYLPSYPPAYGKASEVVGFVQRIRHRRGPLLVPLTLHWSWEREDRFESVRTLARALAPHAVSLSSWLDGTAWNAADSHSAVAPVSAAKTETG